MAKGNRGNTLVKYIRRWCFRLVFDEEEEERRGEKKKEEGRTMQMEEALQTSVAKPMFCVSFSAAAVK